MKKTSFLLFITRLFYIKLLMIKNNKYKKEFIQALNETTSFWGCTIIYLSIKKDLESELTFNH